MTATFFPNIALQQFWEDSDYYVSKLTVTDELIQQTESLLGYHLPKTYIELIRSQNGGTPVKSCYPTEEHTSWAEDHIAISSVCGIGGKWGIDSDDFGSRFMIEEWGYPDIGIVICQCPSAGHDAVMLDYRACGRDGEPAVIHVDVESADEPTITFLAKDFASFINGLVNEEVFDTSEEDRLRDLERVAHGKFSPLLAELCEDHPVVPDIEAKIRSICTMILEEKGFFAMHADDLSTLMYDLQFWLYTHRYETNAREDYLAVYDKMIAFGGEFSTGGYAPAFIEDWLEQRIKENQIVDAKGKLVSTDSFVQTILARLQTIK